MAYSETAPWPLLMRTIAAADLETLQDLLRFICIQSTECATLVSKCLLVAKGELMLMSPDEEDEGESDEDTNEHGNDDREKDNTRDLDKSEHNLSQSAIRPRSAKRQKLEFDGTAAELISRYETCDTCKQRFDITLNGPSACRVHNGK